MKIIQISRSYDRKMSDGNYGSIGQFCSVTADLGEKDNETEVSNALYEFCKHQVEKSIADGGEAFQVEDNLPATGPGAGGLRKVGDKWVPAPKKRWTPDPSFKTSKVGELPKEYVENEKLRVAAGPSHNEYKKTNK